MEATEVGKSLAFDPAKHIKGERERGVLYNFLVKEVRLERRPDDFAN